MLLAILVISYRQVIDAYPHGGGAYAVSRDNFGPGASQLAGAALIVDYTLTVAVSIAAGVGQLTSAFPSTAPYTVPICLGILVVITALNLRGLGESARAFLIPTLVFIVGLLAIIAVGLVHPARPAHPADRAITGRDPRGGGRLSVLLVLKAFSAGCSALTGVEAIANGVPLFKEPRVARAKRTELLLGVILAAMLLGLAVLTNKFHVAAADRSDGAEPDHGVRRRAPLGLLHRLPDHHPGTGAGRQHLLRRPARADQPAGPGQLPAPPLRGAGQPAGLRQRHRVLAVFSGAAARGGGRQHQHLDPAVRHRRLHRLHPVPGRPGRPLAAPDARRRAGAGGPPSTASGPW